jgi:hypothetical protein
MLPQRAQRQMLAPGVFEEDRSQGHAVFSGKRMACFAGSRPLEFCPAGAVSTHIPFPLQGWMTAAKRADFQ